MIGIGTFSEVWYVIDRKYKSEFAMKIFPKPKIIDKKFTKNIIKERNLMSKLNHPFLVNMHFSFQDNNYLYMILDLMKGGDLRYYYKLADKKFNEKECKFMVANLILALEYIHTNYIIHCDIKPENIVIDQNGYFKLTDFGIARDLKEESKIKNNNIAGSLGYMAPEIIFQNNINVSVDYFCLGVVAFEMMTGKLPYFSKNLEELKKLILANQVQIKKYSIPEGWSTDSADFINKLIQRKQIKRLGNNNILEIKNHPWLNDIDWKKMYLGQLTSPFIPDTDWAMKNNDLKERQQEMSDSQITLQRYKNLESNGNYSSLFEEYYYFNKYSMKYQKDGDAYINPHLIYYQNNSKIKDDYELINMTNQINEEKDKKVINRYSV